MSKTTVSVVLNGSPAMSRLSTETRRRVLATARELRFRPSWRARALSTQRTHTIGVLYAPPMPLIVRGNYEGIMAGINETLTRRGYHVTFVPLGDDPATWEDLLASQRVDGCLVLSRLHETLAGLLVRLRVPAVLINAEADLALPTVLPDDYGGTVALMRHLLDLGHRRITFFLGEAQPHHSVTQRTEAYRRAMGEAGAGAEVSVVRGSTDAFVEGFVGGGVGPSEASAPRPTAVLAYTHYDAVRLLRLLWEAGVGVPRDVSVATFSDSYPVAEVIPPLTTLALPTEAMGRAAAEMVLEQIETACGAPARRVVLEETLIVRRSTAGPFGPASAG